MLCVYVGVYPCALYGLSSLRRRNLLKRVEQSLVAAQEGLSAPAYLGNDLGKS